MRNDIEYVLDSSIIINFLANEKNVVAKMTRIDPERAVIPTICLAEIYRHLIDRRPGSDELSILLEEFTVAAIGRDVAIKFATLKHAAKVKGCAMDRDIWMVAFCLVIGATFLTADKPLVKRLKDLGATIELVEIS